MGRRDDDVATRVNQIGFLLCRLAPENEHDAIRASVKLNDHFIRETLPALLTMRMGVSLADSQNRVQQEYTLRCPRRQVSRDRWFSAQVVTVFAVDVLEGRWELHVVLDGEAKAVRLVGGVVGILAENDNLCLGKRGQTKGVEYVFGRRENGFRLTLHIDEGTERLEIGSLKVRFQITGPVAFDWPADGVLADAHAEVAVDLLGRKSIS